MTIKKIQDFDPHSYPLPSPLHLWFRTFFPKETFFWWPFLCFYLAVPSRHTSALTCDCSWSAAKTTDHNTCLLSMSISIWVFWLKYIFHEPFMWLCGPHVKMWPGSPLVNAILAKDSWSTGKIWGGRGKGVRSSCQCALWVCFNSCHITMLAIIVSGATSVLGTVARYGQVLRGG